MKEYKVPIQSLIDHIKTAVDVDPWAKKMVEKLLKEQEHEVCENCPYKLEDIGDFSDGYHTFNDLYYQRCVLFATIVNMNKSKAWKTRYHEDGEPCFGGGWFLVTVDTPKGSYGYHYEDKYWDMFDCKELEIAKPWDGYTEEDVYRLLSLEKHGDWQTIWDMNDPDTSSEARCSVCGRVSGRPLGHYCKWCGSTMDKE